MKGRHWDSGRAGPRRRKRWSAGPKGKTNTVVGRVESSQATVGKWRSRLESRLDGLVDEARPGRPRTVTDADVERVVTLTLETTPKDATHWSTRSMARRSGLSHNTVSRIWRAFDCNPTAPRPSSCRRTLSSSRIVILWGSTSTRRPLVLCVAVPVQALDRKAAFAPASGPGRAAHP